MYEVEIIWMTASSKLVHHVQITRESKYDGQAEKYWKIIYNGVDA